jgi:hypothetical protein
MKISQAIQSYQEYHRINSKKKFDYHSFSAMLIL